jgi:hypothetical protein
MPAPVMSQHTPGPWALSPYREHQSAVVMQAGTPRMVCEVYGYSDLPDNAANARLIAAAPALLEALVNLLDWAPDKSSDGPDWLKVKVHANDIERARAAIALAKG